MYTMLFAVNSFFFDNMLLNSTQSNKPDQCSMCWIGFHDMTSIETEGMHNYNMCCLVVPEKTHMIFFLKDYVHAIDRKSVV